MSKHEAMMQAQLAALRGALENARGAAGAMAEAARIQQAVAMRNAPRRYDDAALANALAAAPRLPVEGEPVATDDGLRDALGVERVR